MNIGGKTFKRSDGRWETRYEKGRGPDGKIQYGYCYGKTMHDAEWKRQDARMLIANKEVSDISFADAVEMYKATADGDKAGADLLEHYAVSAYGEKKIGEIKSFDVHELLEQHKRKHKVDGMVALYDAFSSLYDFSLKQGYVVVSPISESDFLSQFMKKARSKSLSTVVSDSDYFSAVRCNAFVALLNDKPSERKFGLLLALEMGLKFAEILALRTSDIDLEQRLLTVNKKLAAKGATFSIRERVLPIPKDVAEYYESILPLYVEDNSLVVKQGKRHSSISILRSEFVRLNNLKELDINIDLGVLRTTFAVNKLQAGVNLVDLAAFMDEPIAEMAVRYERFLKPNVFAVNNCTRENDTAVNGTMNLLILGAGDYGHTVKELAESIGIFDTISFLDDDYSKSETIGVCKNYLAFRDRYNVAFPAFGDNELRQQYMDKLIAAGYMVPKFIHPSATVSPSSKIDNGVIIEANATVNANVVIKRGSLICSSALVDRGAVVKEFCHVDSNATVVKDSMVETYVHIRSGEIYSDSLVG